MDSLSHHPYQHLFTNQYLLTEYYIPSTLLNTEDRAMYKKTSTHTSLPSLQLMVLCGRQTLNTKVYKCFLNNSCERKVQWNKSTGFYEGSGPLSLIYQRNKIPQMSTKQLLFFKKNEFLFSICMSFYTLKLLTPCLQYFLQLFPKF